jgi:phospholipase C
VPAPNVTNWRRENFGDLTRAFRFDSHAEPPKLYDTAGPLQVAQYTSTEYAVPTIPDTNQVPPVQHKGRRPHVG